MPPKQGGVPRPTPTELTTLRSWIETGAQALRRPVKPRTAADLLRVVHTDLESAKLGERRFYRYFTLTNVFNDPAVLGEGLWLYRAALSKAINSLSRSSVIVVPRAVDPDRTVYRIDLRDLAREWYDSWTRLASMNPYALQQFRRDSEEYRETCEWTHTKQPWVRADWFVARATRPPLYHDLLELPETAAVLEEWFEVSVEENFTQGRLARAGLLESGVSPANRLLERHPIRDDRAYWKSYEFRAGDPQSDLLQFPLGPDFPTNPFAARTFRHASGAILFSLENGLLGYMLVNSQGRRIVAAPADLLVDPQASSGTKQVVSGLSCISCHRSGVFPVKDAVVGFNKLPDNDPALAQVAQIYPMGRSMDKLVKQDRARYSEALALVYKGIMDDEDAPGNTPADLPEPIGIVARRFHHELQLDDVARELGVDGEEALREKLRGTSQAVQHRLGPLLTGGSLSREAWEEVEIAGGNTLFQRVASELQLGIPIHEPPRH
jgi:hypothetical protein